MTVVSNQYKIEEAGAAKNTGIAASATEVIVAGTQRVDDFNTLLVQNLDPTTDIEVRLDGQTGVGRAFFVQHAGGILNIRAEDNIHFKQVINVNLDSANAETVNKILFTWTKSVVVGS